MRSGVKFYAYPLYSRTGASPVPMLSVNMKIPKEFRSLPEGAVERSETEGVKIDFIKLFKNSPRHFFYKKTPAPLKMGRKYYADLIKNADSRKGCPYGDIQIENYAQSTLYTKSTPANGVL